MTTITWCCKYTIRIKTSAQLSTCDDSCQSIAGQSNVFIKYIVLKFLKCIVFITHWRFTFLKETNDRNHYIDMSIAHSLFQQDDDSEDTLIEARAVILINNHRTEEGTNVFPFIFIRQMSYSSIMYKHSLWEGCASSSLDTLSEMRSARDSRKRLSKPANRARDCQKPVTSFEHSGDCR